MAMKKETMAALRMYPKVISQSMSEKTESDTLFQSHGKLALSSGIGNSPSCQSELPKSCVLDVMDGLDTIF